MKIVIDEDIILEMSDILTELTYSINKPGKDEYFELFILLKNLYDSIGYYSYNDLEAKDVWGYSLRLMMRLKELTTLNNTRLEDRVKTVVEKLQKYLDDVHGSKNLIVIPKWPKPIVEKDQMERDLKRLTWRFGCCLAICLRAGGRRSNTLIQFLFEFLDFLNDGLYGSQGISLIEEKLTQYEKKFNDFPKTQGYVGYPLDIIEKEYILTVNEIKKIFRL